MSDLTDLITALEHLKAPNRDIDLGIGELWPEPRPFDLSLKQNRGMKPPVYRFTESMDHARALMRKICSDHPCMIYGPTFDGLYRCSLLQRVDAYAASEPIAMCLAILYYWRNEAM